MLVPEITTDRLALKALDPDNLSPAYLEWLHDPRVTQFLEIRFYPQTAQSVSQFVRDMNRSPNNYLFGIFTGTPARHIGNIKLGPVDPHHLRGDVGLLIGESAEWGKGLATEAIRAVTDYAFGELKLHKVTAGCYGVNAGSRAAFRRAGWRETARRTGHWRCEGVWTDDIVLECLNPAD